MEKIEYAQKETKMKITKLNGLNEQIIKVYNEVSSKFELQQLY